MPFPHQQPNAERHAGTAHGTHAAVAHPVTATVHWAVTWSGAGRAGAFPDMTTTVATTFPVAESQAVNTGGG